MATTKRAPQASPRSKALPAEPPPKSDLPTKPPRPKRVRALKAPVAPESVAPPANAALPRPAHRMVFIDVENTSSEADLLRVLDELEIRELGATTELTAIGNWRVVGQGLGRSLAARGAHLVHSAPAVRVSDWSDLWIAVHAGIWLGRARPGDTIEIVSHDRAFDAVGDAASRLGITFRRVTYRGHTAAAERVESAGEGGSARGNRRGGRGRRPAARIPRAPSATPPPHRPVHEPAPPPTGPAASQDAAEPHSASHDQIRAIVTRLTAADPVAGVGLDRLTVALKAAGFQRPPGSPRLVTRLRRLSDLEVLPTGRVRLRQGSTAVVESVAAITEGESGGESSVAVASLPSDGVVDVTGTTPAIPRPRSRRRGGRRRRGSGSGSNGGGRPPESAPPAA